MRRILHAMLALGLLGAGGTALAAVAYLMANPLALTSQSEQSDSFDPGVQTDRTIDVYPFLPTSLSMGQIADAVRSRPKAPAPEPAAPKPEPKALVPCSEWLDMGPAAVAREGKTERRRVRLLCPADANVTETFGPEA